MHQTIQRGVTPQHQTTPRTHHLATMQLGVKLEHMIMCAFQMQMEIVCQLWNNVEGDGSGSGKCNREKTNNAEAKEVVKNVVRVNQNWGVMLTFIMEFVRDCNTYRIDTHTKHRVKCTHPTLEMPAKMALPRQTACVWMKVKMERTLN